MMKALLLLAVLFAPLLLVTGADVPRGASSPVLVELFTSEGCSSCPPADKLLQELDRQSTASAPVIVLSEHVDYWNHIGWKDPYSSAFFSQRQNTYRGHLGLDSVYTPQMIIDGTTEFVGNDSRRAEKAIAEARNTPKTPVRISAISASGGFLRAFVEAEMPGAAHNPEVFVVLALDHAESQVSAGENSGRHLTHVGVVQALVKIGSLERGQTFSKNIELKLDPHVDRSNLRLIAFVQEPGPGKVLGAAQEKVKP